ncbi:hypothetical protein FPRO03_12653 [Fusarium proliferatum]|nr:hypothetical protein FPRO03_12653 [Fusarium proliferatum]
MANPQPPVVIIIDDDDALIPHPRDPVPQAPPIQGISIIEAIDQTGYSAGRPPMSLKIRGVCSVELTFLGRGIGGSYTPLRPAKESSSGFSSYQPYAVAISQTSCRENLAPRCLSSFTEGYLTRAELTIFIDLAQMMHDVEEGPNVPYQLKHWRHFWEQNAFKNWDTTSGNTDDLPLRPVTLQENRVRVGKLKVNHPPSLEFPNPPGPARLSGCPIYMSVSPATQDQLIQLIWKDENGKFINPRYVEMDMPVGTCIDLAVLKFDRTATSRIQEYNKARITNAARRRLIHLAAVGTGVAPSVTAEGQAPILEVPELVGHRVAETANI